MNRRYKKTNYPKRRKRIRHRKSSAGPILKLIAAVLGVLIGIAVVGFGTMFVLEVFLNIDTPLKPDGVIGRLAERFNAKLVESPTPYITPEPTPTPYPMNDFDPANEEREIVFPAEFSYSYLGDPYCFNGKIVCSAGKLIDGTVKMFRLVEYDIASGSMRELSVQAKNDHLLFPAFNETWLVYFDAHYTVGGGNICAINTSGGRNQEPVIIKEVYIGQPELKLYGNYITWVERTGSDRDKIFVCDLSSGETTVLQSFNRSDYGTSMPSFGANRVLWAAEDSSDLSSSSIRYIDLSSSSISEYHPGVYVHDPEYNGKYYAWLDAHHAEDTKLYVSDGVNAPFAVETGVTEFGLADDFVAYGKENVVYIYIFETGLTYRMTPEREEAQFLGVSGGAVLWMDVTSRERDIIKFAFPPLG